MKKVFFVTGTVLAILAGCSKGSITSYDCTGTTPTYTNDVKAILDANCATSGCHSASSKKDGYDLSSYTAAKSASGNSAFLGSIQHTSGYKPMPEGGSLSDAQVKLISCWVQNGAPQ